MSPSILAVLNFGQVILEVLSVLCYFIIVFRNWDLNHLCLAEFSWNRQFFLAAWLKNSRWPSIWLFHSEKVQIVFDLQSLHITFHFYFGWGIIYAVARYLKVVRLSFFFFFDELVRLSFGCTLGNSFCWSYWASSCLWETQQKEKI